MHPTLALPIHGRVTPTAEQLADMRALVLRAGFPSADSRHLFAEGWLTAAINDLASEVITDHARGIVARALAVIAVVEQLDAEAEGFNIIREDPETGQDLPAGVDGYTLGRYAR